MSINKPPSGPGSIVNTYTNQCIKNTKANRTKRDREIRKKFSKMINTLKGGKGTFTIRNNGQVWIKTYEKKIGNSIDFYQNNLPEGARYITMEFGNDADGAEWMLRKYWPKRIQSDHNY